MLPKKERLEKYEVEEVFKHGKFVNSPNLSLKFLRKNDKSTGRFSFIVPKTVSKSAALRNRLRRRGYNALAELFKIEKAVITRGMRGAFLFSKRAAEIFGGRKNKENNSKDILKKEIKIIFSKL